MLKLIYNYLINSSIRRKFFLGYLIVAIIPVFVISFYFYNTTKNNLIEQNYQSMQNNLLQTSSNIEKKLEGYSKSSSLIYLNNDLKNYLVQDYTKANIEDAYYFINKFFSNMLILNPDTSLITVYTPNITLPADQYYIKHLDNSVINEKWYNNVKNSSGNVVYGSTFKDSSGNYVFTLARYLNSGSINFPYGLAVLTIQEAELYSLIEKTSLNSFSFIVDQEGNIVSSKDKSLITKNIFDILNIDKSELINKNRLDVQYNNQKMLLVYNTLNNGWQTLTMTPYNSFLSNARKSASYILVFSLAMILLAIVMVFTLSKILTKRINILAKQAIKIQNGDFDFELKNMGSDEVGKLSDAFNNMNKKIKFLIEEVYQKEILKKQAELNVLQEQINPHFLYNVLASISSLALRSNNQNVVEMTSLLSKFYRMSLNNGNYMLSIKNEIELTKYYIEIQKRRFKDLLNITFSLDDNLLKYKTLKLILQPFIENSINHGIWSYDCRINIIIKLYKAEDKIIFEVIDDGIGISKKKLCQILNEINNMTTGYGIKNVNNRIKLYFGDNFGVQVFSRLGIGTQVKITIPIQR
ncbi:histidine kinase [Clostridium sp. SYSU_GA19001]|uniref:sensor histidine kinase n=1 Tax=Clostridium caldaquaticum TaxID=2940653 RepID=UPI002076FC94|nr:sensor histidine kinase [Clostridium caldaquaticum]MCM8710736.1 histidine kinase [Clostridium caldaquaticum]